jgi:hypothetical protein
MLRRFGAERMPASVMELGYLKIDLHQRQVTVNGREVGLTRTEFDVLRVLGNDQVPSCPVARSCSMLWVSRFQNPRHRTC